MLLAGADKVGINTAAVKTPQVIDEAAEAFGCQCLVVAIDAKRNDRGSWTVFTHGGRNPTELDAVEWAAEVCGRGAGEILLTSMDADGTKAGYDIALTRAVSEAVGRSPSSPAAARAVWSTWPRFCATEKPTPFSPPASSISANTRSAT